MQLTSPGKLAVLVLALVGAFVGMFTHTMPDSTAIAIIGHVVGYVVGNGTGALRGNPQAPLFAPKPTTEQSVEPQ